MRLMRLDFNKTGEQPKKPKVPFLPQSIGRSVQTRYQGEHSFGGLLQVERRCVLINAQIVAWTVRLVTAPRVFQTRPVCLG